MTATAPATLSNDAPSAALELTSVTKRFGSTSAVQAAAITVAPGELVALVGPSGCGKSTLLRLVAGLHHCDSGTITIGGLVVDDGRRVRVAPEHRRVGLVFQEHALFPHLSVAGNVGFGLRRDPQRAARTAEMLELVGLTRHGDRYPHELSGGERQRVALARALAPRPGLMLLDEPFASLDPNLRARLRAEVLAILGKANTAAMLVTHDQSEALASGERVAVMHDGVIVQCDTPAAVFHAPVSRFVGAFMGEADFLEPEDLAPLTGLGRSEYGAATVMVRPHDIALVAEPTGTATVVEAEFRGSTWCYTVVLPTGKRLRALRSHTEPLVLGQAVRVEVVSGHRLAAVPPEAEASSEV